MIKGADWLHEKGGLSKTRQIPAKKMWLEYIVTKFRKGKENFFKTISSSVGKLYFNKTSLSAYVNLEVIFIF